MTPTEPPSRRDLLGIGLMALPVLGGGWVLARVAASPAAAEGPDRVPLCPLAEVPETGLLRRSATWQVRRGPALETETAVVFLGRDEAGEVMALSGRCTHLGCTVRETTGPEVRESGDPEAPLVCPCHDGRFAADGEVLAGPPPRPLERLELELPEEEDGIVHLLLEHGR